MNKTIISAFQILLLAFISASCKSPVNKAIKQFDIYEAGFHAHSSFINPYTEVSADAEIVRPDGSKWTIPLFWDGENVWKLRISPDMEGKWSYKIISNDRGLNNKKSRFKCIVSDLRGTIEPMKGYPTHFQYRNGEQVWFMGETAWALFTDNEEERHDRQAVENFIRIRSAQGFNAMHAMMLSEAGWGNQGGMPFRDISNQIINPRYWQEVDYRVKYANDYGLVVGMVLAWGDKNRKIPFPWRMYPDLEARKRYARYAAARYSAYNVYFILSGEWHGEVRTRPSTEEEMKKEFIEIGKALDDAEPHGRMIAIHPMINHGSVREYNEASWMSFGDYQQNYHNLHERIIESLKYNKPVVNSEYGYYLRDQNGDSVPDKENSTCIESIRHASWDIVMAGGYFVTGFGTTYFGGYRDPGPFNIDDPKNDDWELQTGLIGKFFTGMEWFRLKPHDELVNSAEGRGRDTTHLNRIAPPLTAYWLLADPGNVYVVYARGVKKKLDIGPLVITGKGYGLSLFNPRTGELAAAEGDQVTGKDFTWTPPDGNDWILVLKSN